MVSRVKKQVRLHNIYKPDVQRLCCILIYGYDNIEAMYVYNLLICRGIVLHAMHSVPLELWKVHMH